MVGALAGGAGVATCRKRSCQDFRKAVSFCKQSPEHSGGSGGCFASWASVGIAAGLTGSGDSGSEVDLQAVTSTASVSQGNTTRSSEVLGELDGFIFGSYAAFKFIALRAKFARMLISGSDAFAGEISFGLGMGGALVGKAHSLGADGGQQQADGQELYPLGDEAEEVHGSAFMAALNNANRSA
jgi:hypothetical protein